MGGVGVGKTELMRVFAQNQIQSYVLRECIEIAKDYALIGSQTLNDYNEPMKTWAGGNLYGHDILGVCFDDLGTENDKKHFGNNTNVMADIILSRYHKHNMTRHMTHFTTNLNSKEIEEKYGTRVMDRIREMFNIVIFPSGTPSRRK